MSLTPEQWSRVTDAFDLVRAAPPAEREAVLASACADDPAVRVEVESLLAADGDDDFLSPLSSGGFGPFNSSASRLIGRTVGAYRIEAEIGRGGMGVVYEGHHVDATLEKRVAIKTLAIGLDRPELAWRFRRERQILARLEHPNIAALYDGGTTDDGIPYLVMEFVAGVRIDAWCDEHRLTIPERLDLFRQVCAAVEFAHGKLIVHRDLKPNNILVTRDGVAKLLDFGIAKLTATEDDTSGELTEYTRAGAAPLTTAYASPEQVRGEEVTTASDVYSLGVILYRLLTGTSPFAADAASPAVTRGAIADESVRTPSEAVTGTQPEQCRLPNVPALQGTLRGELDAIVLMALRAEPSRRYSSAGAFSADVLRYLRGLPVQATPDTVGYRVTKFVRRQKALVAGVSVAVLAMVAGTALAVRSARTATAEAARARSEAARANSMVTFLQTVVGAADASLYGGMNVSKDITLPELLDSTRARIPTTFPQDARSRADLYTALARSLRRFNRYDPALALLDSAQMLHRVSAGDISLEVAEDMTIAALIQNQLGRRAEAKLLLEGALDRYRRLPEAPPEASTIAKFGMGQMMVHHLDKIEAGVQLLTEAAAQEARAARPRNPLVGSIETQRAVGLNWLGKLAESDTAFSRAIELFVVDSARNREELAAALVNWGMMLSGRAQYDQAVPLLARGLRLIESANGPHHMVTAILQSRMASTLNAAGDFRRAGIMADSALSAHAMQTTENPSELAYAMVIKARSAIGMGNLAEATRMIDQAKGLLPRLSLDRTLRETAVFIAESRLFEARGDLARARASADQAMRSAGSDKVIQQSVRARLKEIDSLGPTAR